VSDATRIATLERTAADVAEYLDELRAALASHDAAFRQIRMVEMEGRISPAPVAPPTVPTAPAVTMGGDVSLAGAYGAQPAAIMYGDLSDGSVTISTNTTLTRDMFYNDLTVNAGIRLNTDGFRVFVRGALTNHGYISNNGGDGGSIYDGTSPGGSSSGRWTVGGVFLTTGGDGYHSVLGDGGAGGIGSSINVTLGGSGGSGGRCVGYPGGAGGWADPPMPHQGSVREAVAATRGMLQDNSFIGGGGGGGGGGSLCYGAGGSGGGGGGGGGVVVLIAKYISNDGVIEANGGAGGDGRDGYFNGSSGGGGGGGGGVVIIVTPSTVAGTVQALGGAGGSGVGEWATAGTAGVDGTVIGVST